MPTQRIQASALRLPDIFALADDRRVARADEWPQRRAELAALLLHHLYGPLPDAPQAVRWLELHRSQLGKADPRFAGASLLSLRLQCVGSAAPPISLQLWLPPARPKGPLRWPVLLSGDGCWHNATDEVKALALSRGYALALFNRVELAPDPEPRIGGTGAQAAADGAWTGSGALAVWAWGYQRCVDALLQMPFIEPQKIAVVGHSRGGKAALLAGALDERITLTSANNSGAAGAGSALNLGPGAETLADVVHGFPHWLGPKAPELARLLADPQAPAPLDMHFLLALVAPRALLTTEALDDAWANPQGTRRSHEAARAAFEFLGAAKRLAMHSRPGGHAHSLADWTALLDFADQLWR